MQFTQPTIGQLNEFGRYAHRIIAENMRTGDKIKYIAWYHYEVAEIAPKTHTLIYDA